VLAIIFAHAEACALHSALRDLTRTLKRALYTTELEGGTRAVAHNADRGLSSSCGDLSAQAPPMYWSGPHAGWALHPSRRASVRTVSGRPLERQPESQLHCPRCV